MTYNANEILHILDKAGLGTMNPFISGDENSAFDLWENIESLTDLFSYYETGATKMVLIPRKGDYVVKIPFTGSTYCDYDNSDYENYKAFMYANNLNNDWDYCAVEAERYEMTINSDIEHFFAKTECIGYVGDMPVYVQPACCTTLNMARNSSADSRKRAGELRDSLYSVYINDDWLGSIIEIEGEQALIDLLNFLEDMDWRDFHKGNIGYLHGNPVIFDYSGYNE